MTTDPVSIAGFALTLATKTTEALTALRERAQRSKDVDIKEQINTLFDNILQLKDVVSRLLDENRELLDENRGLRRQLEEQQHPGERPKIKQVGEANYYFIGEEGPFCQPCYVEKGKLVNLSPQKRTEFEVYRWCSVCKQNFSEGRIQHSPAHERWGGEGGPQGWMR